MLQFNYTLENTEPVETRLSSSRKHNHKVTQANEWQWEESRTFHCQEQKLLGSKLNRQTHGDVLWTTEQGSSMGLRWRMGGSRVQPLLSVMCLFSPSLSLAPGWQEGCAHRTENVTTGSCIFTHPKSSSKVPEASILKLALLTSPP